MSIFEVVLVYEKILETNQFGDLDTLPAIFFHLEKRVIIVSSVLVSIHSEERSNGRRR